MPPENDDSLNPSPDASETPKADDLGSVANAAAKSHVSRFAEKVLPGYLAAALKPLQDEIAALRAPKPDDDDAGTSKKGKADPVVAALQAQLEDFKTKFTSEQTARQAAEAKARDERAHSALKSELASQVRPELLGILTNDLYHQRKVIEFADDGTPLFKSQKVDMYGDLEDVRMPLKDGVANFLKSEEAKAFLPAPSPGAGSDKHRKVVSGNRSTTAFDPATASEADKIRNSIEVVAKAQAKGIA